MRSGAFSVASSSGWSCESEDLVAPSPHGSHGLLITGYVLACSRLNHPQLYFFSPAFPWPLEQGRGILHLPSSIATATWAA